jgi:hypothetical protein
MEGADALGLIAEIGIAIAGFAGVVVTLRAPGGTMGNYEAMRIGALLGWSVSAVLAALLPFALHFAGLAEATIWTLSSSVLAALVVTVYLGAYRIFRALTPGDRAPGYRFAAPLLVSIAVGAFLLQVANVLFFRQLWPFYVGLLVITTLSLFQFAYVLFAPSRAEVAA